MGTRKIKILVVEDEPSIQHMYKMKMELAGFEVETADNGRQGLEAAERFKPTLILLDLKMPEMTGEEMLEKLRETDWGANIRVIVLTNISKDEAPKNLQLLNVERYIVKAHHTPAQLVDDIKKLLKV